MKKLTAVILLAVMLFSSFSSALAIGETKSYRTVTSTIDVPLGEQVDAAFTASAKGCIKFQRSDKTALGTMTDSGFGADARRNDGIQSFGMKLYSDERKTEKYYASRGDEMIAEYTVNYYKELTRADFDVKAKINEDVCAIEKSFEGKSKTALFDAVYEYVSGLDEIVSVGRTENSITYTTEAGITSVFTQFTEGTKGGGSESEVIPLTEDGMNSEATLSWTNPNILLLRPFRNSISDNGAGFATDVYLDAIKPIKSITGGKLYTFDDEEANPYNLADMMDKVGFVFIDSHGVDVQVDGEYMSTIILENTNNDGITDADWSAARVLDIYNEGLVAVRGDYIKAKYEAENRRLENTMIHLGICLGMKYESIYKPFYELGAAYIDGYTETVSTWYDANCVYAISTLISRQKPGESRSYNFTEAIAYAKQQFGEEDPAGWGAVIKTYGNENMTCIVPATGIDTVKLDDFEVTVNNFATVPLIVTVGGENAYAYKTEWESSNEAIFKVDANRTVVGVKEGTARLVCRVTSGSETIEKSCSVNVTYIPAESVKLMLRQTSMSVGGISIARSVIYPRTTSEKGKTLFSTNTGSVELKGKLIYTKKPGNTYIVVTTESGLTDSKKLSISTKAVYAQADKPYEGNTYALYTSNSYEYSVILSNKKSGSYLSGADASANNGFITSTVPGAGRWLIEGNESGFYIKSEASGQYLSLKDGKIAITDEKLSVFVQDSARLKVDNTDSSSCYLKYQKDKGFTFSSRAQASKIYFYKLMSYSDDNLFATVKFEVGNNTYCDQRVEKGERAIAATPLPQNGKIFKGYDKPLCNIQEDMVTNALWKDGTLADNKILITFMYTNGKIIEEKEFTKGASITAPTPDAVQNGVPFAYWSEPLSKANYNMTVFAIYEQTVTYGDVNGDGKVNTADATSVLKYAAGMTELNGLAELAADVNRDGKVNTADATAILKFAAGMISEF